MTGKKESMEQIIKRMEGYGSGNNPRKVKAEEVAKKEALTPHELKLSTESVTETTLKTDKEIQTVNGEAADNYFTCNLQNYSFKDDSATMEAPIFSLSTQEDKKIWTWTSADGKKTVEVAAGAHGRATVFDKDILIFAASQIMAAINNGEKYSRKIRFKASDYFKATMRNGYGDDYDRFKISLQRLQGTQITTNIKTGKTLITEIFGIIEKARIIAEEVGKESKKTEMIAVEITLSEWLYNAILAQELLTITPKYFTLRKPLERRLYEIARKHVGKQAEWRINIENLQSKCGSVRQLRKFKLDLKALSILNNIPDYKFSLDGEIVTFSLK